MIRRLHDFWNWRPMRGQDGRLLWMIAILSGAVVGLLISRLLGD